MCDSVESLKWFQLKIYIMFTHVVSEVVFKKELLVAYFAFEFVDQFAFHVTHFMDLQIAHNRKLTTAIATTELRFHVNLFVVVQPAVWFEVVVAYVTFERFVVGMR